MAATSDEQSALDTGLYDATVHDAQIVALYETDAETRSAMDILAKVGFSAISRGHAVLVVTPDSTMDREHLIHVLESTNPLDFDARLEAWRQTGYKNIALAAEKHDRADSNGKLDPVPGFAALLSQLTTMIVESGAIDGFDADRWLSRWLHEPLPAFGGKLPLAFMTTPEGRKLVSSTLAQLQTGAYA